MGHGPIITLSENHGFKKLNSLGSSHTRVTRLVRFDSLGSVAYRVDTTRLSQWVETSFWTTLRMNFLCAEKWSHAVISRELPISPFIGYMWVSPSLYLSYSYKRRSPIKMNSKFYFNENDFTNEWWCNGKMRVRVKSTQQCISLF